MKTALRAEKEFNETLRSILAGKQGVGSLLEHPEFELIGRRFCSRFKSNGEWDAEDLYQEACLRVLKWSGKLSPDNIPDEEAFFSWLFKVVQNVYRSKLRKSKAVSHLRKIEAGGDSRPAEELIIPDLSINLDNEVLLKEFEMFSRVLPKERLRSLMLWFEDRSYREIAVILNSEGIRCSHTTVRHWVDDAFTSFREAISAPSAKTSVMGKAIKKPFQNPPRKVLRRQVDR